jgi:hypothetical protein
VLDSLYPASLEPYGHSFATTATSATPSAAAALAAPDASLQAVTTSSFLSQLATSSAYHSPLPLSTLLSSNVSIYAQQPPTPSAAPLPQQQPTVLTTTPPSLARGPSSPVVQRQQFGVPGAPTHAQDNITLYQQDAILPPNPQRYSLDGFGVSPSARNAMLAYLPFLSKYNITSSDVPFVVSDPEYVCRFRSCFRFLFLFILFGFEVLLIARGDPFTAQETDRGLRHAQADCR